jgi:hypothetical protein
MGNKAITLMFMAMWIVGCGGGVDGKPGACAVLVDSIHAHNFLRVGPEDDPYAYHNLYGYRLAFDYLKSRKMIVDEVSDGRITRERLAGHSMLFINLVSADLPAFGAGEILAIKDFVERGGGLFLITDHTNCYYHLNKLSPLLDELDIRMRPETACEFPPRALGQVAGGWITIEHFKPHPVTAGLRTIAFESGGTVDDRFAVATTSERAWGDASTMHPFGEGDTPGFYGNWKPDPGERTGMLGVVLAKQVGKGRVVIVADQNIFGDPFINYADNGRLFLNAIAWLSGKTDLGDVAAYERWRRPAVLCYEEFGRAAFGNPDPKGYFPAYAQLTQAFPTFARDHLEGDWGTIVFAHPDYQLGQADLDALVEHLRRGKSVVILNGAGSVKEGRGVLEQLTARLGPAQGSARGRMLLMDWPEAGRVIVLTDAEELWKLPAPEKKPDALDQVRIEMVISAVRMGLSGAERL